MPLRLRYRFIHLTLVFSRWRVTWGQIKMEVLSFLSGSWNLIEKKKKKNIHKARLCVLQFGGKRLIPVGIIRKDS
jgi:hypothetical protein